MFNRIDRTTWPIWALISSAAMLAGAHAFEIFGRLGPCPLCLRQREVYWAAIAMIIGMFIVARLRSPASRLLPMMTILLGMIFVTGAVIATYHAGAEWKFWPGPEGCSGQINIDALTATSIDLGQKFKTVSCTEAPWRMFGISMAGYNAVISLVLATISIAVATRANPLLSWGTTPPTAQVSSSTSQ